MRLSSRRLRSALVVLMTGASAAPGWSQALHQTIRGRITSDSGPVSGAIVSATMAPDRTFRQETTGSDGRFEIRFAAGTGDYLLHAAAAGFKPIRKRITLAPSDTAFVWNVQLESSVAQLTAIHVEAAKPKPTRDAGPRQGVGAAEQAREGVFAAVAPGDEGNLASIANAIPGATSDANGLSVLGLDGAQSNTTLNGMAFGGLTIPRDAQTVVRVTTSTYDPSRGGFSGGQTSIELAPGGPLQIRLAHAVLDAPVLQAPARLGDAPEQRFTAVNGSMGAYGQFSDSKWYYNGALQVSRRAADAATLLSSGSDVLLASGIAADSATRLQQVLQRAQIPVSVATAPSSTVSRSAVFMARFDHGRFEGQSRDPARATWNLTLFGNIGDAQGQSYNPTSNPTVGGTRTDVMAGAQTVYSRFFGDVLNDTRTAFSTNVTTGTPYLQLPGGRVLVSSSLGASESNLTYANLAFGGNALLDYRRHAWSWETINETQFYTRRSPHRIKVTFESRLDGYHDTPQDNLLGAFTYPSLSAIATNQPSSFTRTLNAPVRIGGEWSAFAAIGDYWRVTPSLQLLYGARVEQNRFTTRLAHNPEIERVFGASTSHVPEHLHVSPRVGFTWFIGQPASGTSVRYSRTATQTLARASVLRGGIGEFRNLLPASLLGDASVASGLPGGASHVTCIGDAVPVPQWNNYLTNSGSIPNACANGATPAFSDAAPVVRLFDAAYDAARSWRGNLSWSSAIGKFGVTVEGVYSLNLDQPGTVDLNFAGTPKFALADEGGRPVFVAPSAIVPGSGAVSPSDARVNDSFGRVLSARSDLSSVSRQLTVTIAPQRWQKLFYSVAYTLGDNRGEARGFDASTFGSPTLVERAAGPLDVRHQLLASAGIELPHGVTLSLFARLMSGVPYTPIVAGDINGDGMSNDRAFIFDPLRTSDVAMMRSMSALLAETPSQARSCLEAQLGRAAERSSCRGPWTAYTSARIGLYQRSGPTRRTMTAILHVTNPLAGLDQLVHGANSLQGWGGGSSPDPVLLTVRGFDPATSRFKYEVNQRFGRTTGAGRVAQVPFRVTIDFSFDLADPPALQQTKKLLNPGRHGHVGKRLTADSMAVLMGRNVADVYRGVLAESDSLLLSRDQIEALEQAQAKFQIRLQGMWKATATELEALGEDYDSDRAMHLIDDATERGWIMNRDELPVLAQILSPIQMRLAPLVHDLELTIGKKVVGMRAYYY